MSEGATRTGAERTLAVPERPSPRRPARFDVELFGNKYLRWLPQLEHDSIWTGLPQVSSVTHRRDDWRPPASEQEFGRHRLIIPLHEHNIAAIPRGYWALPPTTRALRIFADKQLFARFAAARGLELFVPRTYVPGSEAFPLVLKRTNLCASKGVALVRNRADLAHRLGEAPWRDRPVLLQEYIDHDVDYVTHAVCIDGRVAWHRSYCYRTAPGAMLVPNATPPVDTEISEQDLSVLRRFVEPLSFSGPLSVDYRRRPDGRPAILEINPRFGGSLFWPQYRPHLREALDVVIANARWMPEGDG